MVLEHLKRASEELGPKTDTLSNSTNNIIQTRHSNGAVNYKIN